MFQRSVAVVIALATIFSCKADQLPISPPAEWTVSVRVYGTTDPPGRDIHQVFVYTNGVMPVMVSAVRPRYLDAGSMAPDSPRHTTEVTGKAAISLYDRARAVVMKQRVGTPRAGWRDGTSVEVKVGSSDKQIGVTFDHSTYTDSLEFRKLKEAINAELPRDFRIR